ncbi:MAG: hypothetical protein PWP65_736 [Clostridia bacterium]|nr:hypothetical protein [Clostridia bacterium]
METTFEALPLPAEASGNKKQQARPVNLAAYSQTLLREALLNGRVEHALNQILTLIGRLRQILDYAEAGTHTAAKIAVTTKEQLARELGLPPGGQTTTPPLALNASSIGLFWNLLQTEEFQKLTASLLVQILKSGAGKDCTD